MVSAFCLCVQGSCSVWVALAGFLVCGEHVIRTGTQCNYDYGDEYESDESEESGEEEEVTDFNPEDADPSDIAMLKVLDLSAVPTLWAHH